MEGILYCTVMDKGMMISLPAIGFVVVEYHLGERTLFFGHCCERRHDEPNPMYLGVSTWDVKAE